MFYTKVFTPQYQNGWKNKPDTSTPVIAEALNDYDGAITHIEDYLYDNPPILVEDISNDLFIPETDITMGECIAHKYGNVVMVERLRFNSIAISTSADIILASINPDYTPATQGYMRILWNPSSSPGIYLVRGFISGDTNKISIGKYTSAITSDIFAVGFTYLIA